MIRASHSAQEFRSLHTLALQTAVAFVRFSLPPHVPPLSRFMAVLSSHMAHTLAVRTGL